MEWKCMDHRFHPSARRIVYLRRTESVHQVEILIVRIPNPSMRWTVIMSGRPSPPTDNTFVKSFVQIRPWGGRSIVKNPSTPPPQNDNLGPAESVHEMDDQSLNFGGRVRGALLWSVFKNIYGIKTAFNSTRRFNSTRIRLMSQAASLHVSQQNNSLI